MSGLGPLGAPGPLGAVGAFAKANPVKTAMGAGSIGGAAFVTSMLGVAWPEGDPDKLRSAADIWEGLAETIERAGADANGVAEQVWKNNGGAAVQEFEKLWTGKIRPYPDEVAKFCRAIAKACRDYAQSVEITQYVLIVLAIQAWVNMVYTVAWAWATAGIGAAVQKQIMDRFLKGRAILQMKIFKISVEKIIYNSFYYLGDSLAYAGGQQALQWSIFELAGVKKDLTGNDVTGAGENFKQFGRGFASNMAFNGAYDLTKIGPWGKAFPGDAAGNLMSRLVGSGMYTVADNTLQGDPALPTWEQWISKIIVHGSRTAKPPA
ncbi:WXG100-like domain-containing protein [Streptosporangium sp. LJ11]|uniref:WXG100-like domain-containing protein n=1 Tax=Streptosporangium sp. LJ11 TaxID=3436927 RepID=UPI003F799B60